MKSFREFCMQEGLLDDVLNVGSKFLYFWHNHWILNTRHGLERITQRSKLTVDQMKQLFRGAIDKFDTMAAQLGQELLFYSKSLQQGFVAAVGPQGNLQLITFLPPGRSNPKPGTEKIVFESIDGERFEFDNITVVEID